MDHLTSPESHGLESRSVSTPRSKLTCRTTDRDLARSIAGAMQDLVDPAPNALSLFEEGPDDWRIDAYYSVMPDAKSFRDEIATLTGLTIPELTIEDVPDLNWVVLSQKALPPVHAGRFTVHGSHDRAQIPQGPNAILIDAGEAFGTAHHATTLGCLLAIDRLTRRARFPRILDLGSGSGVLAIAAARALPEARILATDLDTQSVFVAAQNMRTNRVLKRICIIRAAGFDHALLRRARRFHLVIANILAEPLIQLANKVAGATLPGGMLVLSGILTTQAPQVIAAYRSAGFTLASHQRITGWSTLILKKR